MATAPLTIIDLRQETLLEFEELGKTNLIRIVIREMEKRSIHVSQTVEVISSQSIQECGPSKICGRLPLKKYIWSA